MSARWARHFGRADGERRCASKRNGGGGYDRKKSSEEDSACCHAGLRSGSRLSDDFFHTVAGEFDSPAQRVCPPAQRCQGERLLKRAGSSSGSTAYCQIGESSRGRAHLPHKCAAPSPHASIANLTKSLVVNETLCCLSISSPARTGVRRPPFSATCELHGGGGAIQRGNMASSSHCPFAEARASPSFRGNESGPVSNRGLGNDT